MNEIDTIHPAIIEKVSKVQLGQTLADTKTYEAHLNIAQGFVTNQESSQGSFKERVIRKIRELAHVPEPTMRLAREIIKNEGHLAHALRRAGGDIALYQSVFAGGVNQIKREAQEDIEYYEIDGVFQLWNTIFEKIGGYEGFMTRTLYNQKDNLTIPVFASRAFTELQNNGGGKKTEFLHISSDDLVEKEGRLTMPNLLPKDKEMMGLRTEWDPTYLLQSVISDTIRTIKGQEKFVPFFRGGFLTVPVLAQGVGVDTDTMMLIDLNERQLRTVINSTRPVAK